MLDTELFSMAKTNGLRWRFGLLVRASRVRHVQWMSLARAITTRHREDERFRPTLVQEERGLGLFRFQQYEFWFPMRYDWESLTTVVREIVGDHLYDHSHCPMVEGTWVIDAGACEGLFSLYALHRGANVIAIEPIPDVANALERTLEPYLRTGRARIVRCALGLENRNAELEVAPGRILVSGLTIRDRERADICSSGGTICRVPVRERTLDSIASELHVERISLIKADIEGAERQMLRGAGQVLRRFRPALAICSYHLPDDPFVLPTIIDSCTAPYRWQFNGFMNVMFAWPVQETERIATRD